jgi:hypothetical protein
METAAAAERHGWREVEVWGDRTYKDEVTIACHLRGITVTNYRLSRQAQARLDKLIAEKEASQLKGPPGKDISSAQMRCTNACGTIGENNLRPVNQSLMDATWRGRCRHTFPGLLEHRNQTAQTGNYFRFGGSWLVLAGV